LKFTDSINENLELIGQLLGNATAEQKNRAKKTAIKIENVVHTIQKDNQKDGAVGLGLAFAVFYIAQNLVESGSHREDGPKIQLLS
jgi:hypothetical protein